MRIAVGLLIAVDLVNRARAFTAHYTDFGVLPTDVLSGEFSRSLHPSLHALSGNPWFVAALFVAAFGLGLMLMVGYRTRLATIASWVLMVSLHARNPWVLQGGDTLLRLLLFWGMFLPLGARWSIDAIRRGGDHEGELTFTMATVALIAQVCFVYGFATASKLSHSVWFPDGMGVYYALSVEQFTTRIGFLLLELPGLLEILSYATLALQALAPLLLLVPWQRDRIRAGLAVVMFAWHIGFAMSMELGLFSWITCAMWLALLPPAAWSWLGDRLPRWRATAWTYRRSDELLGRLRDRLEPASPTTSGPRRRWIDTVWMRGALALLIVYSLWWNLWQADRDINRMPGSMESVGRLLRLEQRWEMFSSPPRWSQWFVVEGTRRDGVKIDAWSDRALSIEKPDLVSATFPGQRWRKYFNNLARRSAQAHRPHFAAYVCRRWNRDHAGPERITSVRLVRMRQATPRVPGTEPLAADRVVIGDYPCHSPSR